MLYNNLKGKIVDIEDNGISVKFHIEVERAFNGLDVEDANFKLEKPRNKSKSIVSFDWTEKAQRYILEEMHQMYNKQDASIIAKKFKLKMYS